MENKLPNAHRCWRGDDNGYRIVIGYGSFLCSMCHNGGKKSIDLYLTLNEIKQLESGIDEYEEGYPEYYNDPIMQEQFEGLLEDGFTLNEAINKINTIFGEYDNTDYE